jgi:hypothetical protein
MKVINIKLTCCMLFMSIALVSVGQESIDTEAAALAKATQNPLAAMYSLPFQNNTTYRVGEFNRVQNVLNVQPVIPVSFKKFNLINRLIVPVIT